MKRPAKSKAGAGYLDPRDISYVLEQAALGAELRTGKPNEATITISAELAYTIADHLRRVPLRKGGKSRSLYELGERSALVQKARRYKDELVAKAKAAGKKKSATDAEDEAAEQFATVKWSAGTIRRAMQKKAGTDAE